MERGKVEGEISAETIVANEERLDRLQGEIDVFRQAIEQILDGNNIDRLVVNIDKFQRDRKTKEADGSREFGVKVLKEKGFNRVLERLREKLQERRELKSQLGLPIEEIEDPLLALLEEIQPNP